MKIQVLASVLLAGLLFCSSTAHADFDRNNQDDLEKLNHELFDDPLGIGYDIRSGGSAGCALLNDGEQNTGGEVHPRELTPQVVLEAMSFEDYRRATKEGRAYIDLLVGREFGSDLDPYREKLLEALPKNGDTVFPLRRLSRAEVLFGLRTSISRNDCTTARDACGNVVRCP